ncbi:MAG: metal-dependent hydrolase [Candidatus Coatesbacteria bacterium]|nr:metal-dependent hydrolase [Candidatus Coatesbacteria bacterium]
MDPIIHTLAGISINQGFSIHINNPLLFFSGVLFANLPDIDAISDKQSSIRDIFPHHGPSHSIVGGVIFSALGAKLITMTGPLLGSYYTNLSYEYTFVFLLVSFFSHIFLDVFLHSDGIAVFWPVINKKFSLKLILGLTHLNKKARCYPPSRLRCFICLLNSTIMSPILYFLLFGIMINLVFNKYGSIIGFALVLIFTFWLYIARLIVLKKARKRFSTRNIQIFPHSYSGLNWMFLRKNNKSFSTYEMNLKGEFKEIGFYPVKKDKMNEYIEKSKEHFKIRDFLTCAKNPYPTVKEVEEGYLVFWRDLSYDFDKNIVFFGIRALIDRYGQFLDVRFLEKWPDFEVPYNRLTVKPFEETGSI